MRPPPRHGGARPGPGRSDPGQAGQPETDPNVPVPVTRTTGPAASHGESPGGPGPERRAVTVRVTVSVTVPGGFGRSTLFEMRLQFEMRLVTPAAARKVTVTVTRMVSGPAAPVAYHDARWVELSDLNPAVKTSESGTLGHAI